MKIDLSQVKLKPILSSVQRLDISDEIYFGPQYKHYISNSRLKLIDPTCNGSPSTYKAGFTGKTTGSLSLGSNIHMLYLQPEEFELVTDVTLPNGKLGLACEKAIKHYKKYIRYNDLKEKELPLEDKIERLEILIKSVKRHPENATFNSKLFKGITFKGRNIKLTQVQVKAELEEYLAFLESQKETNITKQN